MESLHQRIVADLEAPILAGEWPPGHRIPFEMELAESYGCSRMTANKAVMELVRRGLVERRRKLGSFVAQPQAQSAVLEIRDIAQEVASLGLAHRAEILARANRRASRAECRLSGLAPGSAVAAVELLHFAGGRPFCLEARIISLAAVPEAEDERFATRPPGAWLLDRVPWSRAEHRIRAEPAAPRIAGLLGVAAGAACLAIERRTWSGGAFVTHARLVYPGDRHELVAEFAPG